MTIQDIKDQVELQGLIVVKAWDEVAGCYFGLTIEETADKEILYMYATQNMLTLEVQI